MSLVEEGAGQKVSAGRYSMSRYTEVGMGVRSSKHSK